jgi:hypothetical protein
MTETHSGGCFCGAVAIEARGEPMDMGYCHCNACRAYSGAPFSAFTIWSPVQLRITKGEDLLGAFNKTGFSNRRYCTRCGGHLLSEHSELGFTDILPGVLPTLTFTPSIHINYASAVLPVRDGLPKLKDFPAEAGGSGGTMVE